MSVENPLPTRAKLRGIIYSEAPQWIKRIAQRHLDLVDEITQFGQVPIAPWVLPCMQPQLPPGNGQQSRPCHFCSSIHCQSWCITRIGTRGYSLASLTTWPHHFSYHPPSTWEAQ